MGELARGADGRRLFTPEFKKQQLDRVLRGERTLSELTRELERALGRKTMEVEILQAAQEEVKQRPSWYGVSKR